MSGGKGRKINKEEDQKEPTRPGQLSKFPLSSISKIKTQFYFSSEQEEQESHYFCEPERTDSQEERLRPKS